MAQSKQNQNQSPDLHFERKNHDMVKLPKYAKIHKRPIPHAAVPSPYAGPSIPKTIYISTSTPYMSAVKRVQKLLHHAEKRAMASVDASINNNNNPRNQNRNNNSQQQQQNLLAALARGEGAEQLSKEEVFVKATGRAMKVALKVGRWFEGAGREAEYKVRVSTGSVLVVDDVEEDEGGKERALRAVERVRRGSEGKGEGNGKAGDETIVTVVEAAAADTAVMANTTIISEKGKTGDPATVTTTETAADTTLTSGKDTTTTTTTEDTTLLSEESKDPATTTNTASNPPSKSALKKRKRAASLAATLAETEIPETRTRWVNSVEVAISLK
ncbi:Rpp20 subunit of nuclear RNase MRP and P-domain-containing protein [Aspergillus cavernicola]|uniref:Rpp20 subunit of nuclear RNase MRP and P-domain-containing protein n=1 Tax=Aspergillus cavernicola TaxID=176166 RepID=A0ABR4I5A8_9EURO